MLFRTLSAAVYGIDADLVDIEVDLTHSRGEADQSSSVTIVGLPDAAVRDSRRDAKLRLLLSVSENHDQSRTRRRAEGRGEF